MVSERYFCFEGAGKDGEVQTPAKRVPPARPLSLGLSVTPEPPLPLPPIPRPFSLCTFDTTVLRQRQRQWQWQRRRQPVPRRPPPASSPPVCPGIRGVWFRAFELAGTERFRCPGPCFRVRYRNNSEKQPAFRLHLIRLNGGGFESNHSCKVTGLNHIYFLIFFWHVLHWGRC